MPPLAPDLIAQLNELVGLVHRRRRGAESVDPWVLRSRLLAALERLGPPGSSCTRDVEEVMDEVGRVEEAVERLGAVAEALRDDYQRGYVSRVEELVHADLFSDFFEMARELRTPSRVCGACRRTAQGGRWRNG